MAKKSKITKSAVFEDLGFSPSDSEAMRVKADLYYALMDAVKKEKHTQKTLAVILDEQQPRISNLMNRQLHKFSIEKLLNYLELLGREATIKIKIAN